MCTQGRVSWRRRSGSATSSAESHADEAPVSEGWVYAQEDDVEELARLHYFSFKKRERESEVEFVITVKEFASRNALQMRFYAQADKEINQRTAPFRPFGSGDSLLQALSECTQAIRQFPYDPENG
jgi:hypothetical protein